MDDAPLPGGGAQAGRPAISEDAGGSALARLEILHGIDRGIIAHAPFAQIAAAAAARLRPLLGIGRSSTVLFDRLAGTATIVAVDGASPIASSAIGTVRPIADFLPSILADHAVPHVFDDMAAGLPSAFAAEPIVAAGCRASAWVPMLVDGDLVGVMIHAAADRTPYTAAALAMATEVATQLAIALRSGQEHETLLRTTSHLEVMHEIDRAILDAPTPAEVASRVATRVRWLFGADRLAIARFDPDRGEGVLLVVDRGYDGPPEEIGPPPHGRLSGPDVGGRHEAGVVVDDPDSAPGSPDIERLRAQGLRTIVHVPMLADSTLLGELELAWFDEAAATAERIHLAAEVGARIAASFKHMAGRAAVDRSRAQLELLHRMDRHILEATTSEAIAAAVVGPLLELTGAAVVGVAEAGRDPLAGGSIIGYAGLGAETILEEIRCLPAARVLTSAMRGQREIAVVADLRPVAEAMAGGRATVALGHTKGMVVPLVVGDRLVGAISLAGSSPAMLEPETLTLARAVGDQLAIALDHAQGRRLLELQNARLALLAEIDGAILRAQDPGELAEAVAVRLGRLVGSETTTVSWFRDGRRRVLAVSGAAPDVRERMLDLPIGPVGAAPDEPLTDIVTLRDLAAAVDRWPGARFGVEAGLTVAAVVPLLIGGRPIGEISLAGRDEALLDGPNLDIAREVGNQLAVALGQADARSRLEQAVLRQALVHQIDLAILASDSILDLATRAAGPLLQLLGGRRLDISEYDLERDEGRVLAFAHDGTATISPVGTRFSLRDVLPMIHEDGPGSIRYGPLESVVPDVPLRHNAIAQGLALGAWIPLRADGMLVGAIVVAGTAQELVSLETLDVAREVGDQLAVAIRSAHDRQILADREARLAALLAASPNGILTVDRSGTIAYANPAAHRLFGYQEGTLVAGSILALIRPDMGEGRPDGAGPWLLTAPTAHPLDTDARHQDGSSFPVHVLLAHVESAEGRLVIVTVVDLSERAAFEQRLRQAERLEVLGRFAGILAHDVRNYLTAVTWSADLLAADMDPDDPRLEDVALIKRATADAVDMTRSVLEFSRPASGVPGRIDVASHLLGARTMLARILGDHVRLDLDLDDDLPPAGLDATALTQIVGNLATNARDAMPVGGTFRITGLLHERAGPGSAPDDPGAVAGTYVRLVVTDTGVGMDEETSRRAFEAFYTTKGAGGDRPGTGLGLSSVFLIVSRAGGTIQVDSEVGRGTTFTLDLPVAPA